MTALKVVGIIPSRYASTRFPGKPLAMIGGISMVERVYKQAVKSQKLVDVIVATDDERIVMNVKSFGGNVLMTSPNHQSGTDRCAEVLRNSKENWDVVINIQGDEPFINPEQIDLLIACFENPKTQIATLIKKIQQPEEVKNPNIPKVVIDVNSNALYFSRNVIPFNRTSDTLMPDCYFKHIGIYGYRSTILEEISKLKPALLERIESLEQLRWLENGYSIKTAISQHESMAVDTPEDLEKIKHAFNL